ncbi:MAG: hypothetical protein WDN24_22325 [Sphingomonas sp.]
MFVVIVLMVVFGRSVLLVFLGIGAVEWLTMARVVRGQVLALRQRPFVLASVGGRGRRPTRSSPATSCPNVAAPAIAYLMLTVPQVVMVESILSFLGLGVQEPLTSLGILVHDGADDMDIAPVDADRPLPRARHIGRRAQPHRRGAARADGGVTLYAVERLSLRLRRRGDPRGGELRGVGGRLHRAGRAPRGRASR